MDLVKHIGRQIEWSARTFGPGRRTKGLIEHIRMELLEIEAKPDDLEEWIDVVILGLDGAWRAGYSRGDIAHALQVKQVKNEQREWPDWRNHFEDEAIEHIRTGEPDHCNGAELLASERPGGPVDPETVDHPQHYNAHPSGIECIDVVEHMGFNLGNAVKYIWRADEKGNALEDLCKAAWYVQREIKRRTAGAA